jgi:hypothetical protein
MTGKTNGVEKDMKRKSNTKAEWLGVIATIVFLVIALNLNNGWALLLVGSFALVCLRPALAPMWFRAFGIRNTGRKDKKPPPDD